MIYSSKKLIDFEKKKNNNNFIFSSIFPPDVNISERQAQVLANAIRANGTSLLKLARNLFLWQNLTNSVIVN
jgi:hypothetical protein